MTGRCRDQWHGTPEHKSPAPVPHTPGLYEMPVTRSLSPLAGQLRGLQSNRLPLGMLLCFQLSNEKEAHHPFFGCCCCFLSSSIFTLCGRKNRQPPPVCVPLNRPLLPLWLHPIYLCPITLCGNNKVLPPFSFAIFLIFFHVFADKTLPPCLYCSLHYMLSTHSYLIHAAAWTQLNIFCHKNPGQLTICLL